MVSAQIEGLVGYDARAWKATVVVSNGDKCMKLHPLIRVQLYFLLMAPKLSVSEGIYCCTLDAVSSCSVIAT